MKHLTRRHALLGSTMILPFGLAACPGTTVTPANVAAAIAALTGVISATQALVAAGGLTGGNLVAAQQAIAALQAQVAVLTAAVPASAQGTISNVFDTVTGILQQVAAYLPLVVSVMGMLMTPKAIPDTPEQAALRLHLGELRALAGR